MSVRTCTVMWGHSIPIDHRVCAFITELDIYLPFEAKSYSLAVNTNLVSGPNYLVFADISIVRQLTPFPSDETTINELAARAITGCCKAR